MATRTSLLTKTGCFELQPARATSLPTSLAGLVSVHTRCSLHHPPVYFLLLLF